MGLRFFQYTDENGNLVLTQVSNITNIRTKNSKVIVETVDSKEVVLNTGLMQFISTIKVSKNAPIIQEIETG